MIFAFILFLRIVYLEHCVTHNFGFFLLIEAVYLSF